MFGDFFALYLTLQVPLFIGFILGIVALRREESRLTRRRLGDYAAAGWFTPQEVDMLATPAGRKAALAWARTLRGDRTALMKSFIADATALAATRQRAITGRDPHAAADGTGPAGEGGDDPGGDVRALRERHPRTRLSARCRGDACVSTER